MVARENHRLLLDPPALHFLLDDLQVHEPCHDVEQAVALPHLLPESRTVNFAFGGHGIVIVVAIPNVGPGDWKSTLQSEPLPAPPFKLQPAPSRVSNSRLYVPDAMGPTMTVKEPLP